MKRSLMFFLLLVIASPSPAAKIKSLSLGFLHSCALMEDNRVKCWGANFSGILGMGAGENVYIGDELGEMGNALKEVDLGTREPIQSVEVGGVHTCVLFESGRIKCWGDNTFGQLGLGHVKAVGGNSGDMGKNLPFLQLGTPEKVVTLASSFTNNCALFESGRVKCWGWNNFGQLGLGHVHDMGAFPKDMQELPFVDLGTSEKVIQLVAGGTHNCALLENRKVKCWGINSAGQLGLGDKFERGGSPVTIGKHLEYVDLGTKSRVVELTAGATHTCARFEDKSVKCWGENAFGQLGIGNNVGVGDFPNMMGEMLKPVLLPSALLGIPLQSTGTYTCGLTSIGDLRCWGVNFTGQLALGHANPVGINPGEMGENLPSANLGLPVKYYALGFQHGCAVLLNDGLKCWGDNQFAQLGLGDRQPRGLTEGDIGAGLEYVDIGENNRTW